MAKRKGKKPTGRPPKAIDWAAVNRLCGMFATEQEIASWCSCSVDTLARACKSEKGVTFAEYYEQKSANGHISLRRKQLQLALKGNVVMLIWLGKQHLGQLERTALSGDEGHREPISIRIVRE